MESEHFPIIRKAYSGFNSRDIDRIFSVMDIHVHWPKAFEGGHVIGQQEVRKYWLRQWSEINPTVEPVSVVERVDTKVEVVVDQLVRDLDGNILFEGKVRHVYTFNNELIQRMDIED